MGGVRTDTRGTGIKGVMDCRHHCRHPWRTTFLGCSYRRLLAFPIGLPLGLQLGLGFPSLVLPSVRLGLRAFGWRGPWAFSWRGLGSCPGCWPCPGAPCKIGVSTYCEKRLSSGIFTGEMRPDRYETFLRVSVPCGERFAFPCDSRGKVNEASLAPEALANWQWVLNHGHERPVFATLHAFPAYTAD